MQKFAEGMAPVKEKKMHFIDQTSKLVDYLDYDISMV
jgi:hypothetical protein